MTSSTTTTTNSSSNACTITCCHHLETPLPTKSWTKHNQQNASMKNGPFMKNKRCSSSSCSSNMTYLAVTTKGAPQVPMLNEDDIGSNYTVASQEKKRWTLSMKKSTSRDSLLMMLAMNPTTTATFDERDRSMDDRLSSSLSLFSPMSLSLESKQVDIIKASPEDDEESSDDNHQGQTNHDAAAILSSGEVQSFRCDAFADMLWFDGLQSSDPFDFEIATTTTATNSRKRKLLPIFPKRCLDNDGPNTDSTPKLRLKMRRQRQQQQRLPYISDF